MQHAPIQPYFVMSSIQYYKAVMHHLGIAHFYAFTKGSLASMDMTAVPDGCIDILFKCDDKNPSAHVCGSVLQAQHVPMDPNACYFGVRFYPGYGYSYKNLKSSDIINHQISLIDVLDARDLVEKITTTHNFSYQIHYFLDHYTNFLGKNAHILRENIIAEYMLHQIKLTHGNIRIHDLARQLGYSERYINQKFIESLGLSPKTFCKIMRFQYLLNTLHHGWSDHDTGGLINIASHTGYYDQSHMTKDFNQFTTNTPMQYLELLKETDYKKRIVLVSK